MNLKALKAFRLIVTHGSVSAAARVMNLSQPAVSRLMSLLEDELKLTLFRRAGRRLVLTEEGQAFLHEAGRILANLEELPRIAGEIRAAKTRRLRIVTMPRVALSLVCPAVARFAEKFPDVHVSVDLRARRDLEQWLLGKEYDIGFGGLPVAHQAVRGKPLFKVRLQVLMPRNHRLAKRKEISVEDIVDERMIAQVPGLLMRQQVDEIFESRSLEPTYRLTTSSSQIASGLVAAGAGITIIDGLSAATFDRAKVVLRPLLPERWVNFGIMVARQSELLPLARDFVDCLDEELDHHLVRGATERL
ncbi:LysR family transcriptional regulator [Xanthobacteraceae bacterium Astr-EGSB]|uniref:LysR family transcriptional regulator n=1 Tax=Astrobacterium formosum TaxID=3069710 RepID=UPI0027B1BFF7|nr:LysR family transcriptional regulator [Xanthobacteraceae bacterium Astr-EGSB]